jgi:hypothetical protein
VVAQWEGRENLVAKFDDRAEGGVKLTFSLCSYSLAVLWRSGHSRIGGGWI